MNVTFHGGVKKVTGANYLITEGDVSFLIDCGLQQGNTYCEKQNWDPFPYDPKKIAAVIITHSHIDHIGRLPVLVKNGFRGDIYSTAPTRDAAELLLLDSDHILSQTAAHLHMPELFNSEDIAAVMRRWKTVDYHREFAIGDCMITLYNAGHILGSSFVLIRDAAGTRIIFSGDLGNSPSPILGDKDALPETDYCAIESTYGNRLHEDVLERKDLLEDTIEDTVKAGGTLIIPSFAMERTQELIAELDALARQGRIPRVPIFIDSPLAIKLIAIFQKYASYLLKPIHFDIPGLTMTLTTEESKKINEVKPPKIIIAGSGMSHGGRILFHEQRYLPDPNSTILIVGYQGEGSLGRRILEGAKTVTINGETVPVRCRVRMIAGYSAHADQAQLLAWLWPERERLKKVFIIQGEEAESAALGLQIRDQLAVAAMIPELGERYQL